MVDCPGVEGENLVSSALAALRRRGWEAPPVRIEVTKRIPIAAGMGGGSADAAAALRLALALAPGRPEEVAEIAASLGSDVPSQLAPGLVLGTGAGDQLEPCLPLAPHALAIVPQPSGLSTADVYGEADRIGLGRSLSELSSGHARLLTALRPAEELPGALVINDLEPAATSLAPVVATALAEITAAGAEQTLVCGSGPTSAGLFWGEQALARATSCVDRLRPRYPGALVAEPVGAEFGAPEIAASAR